MTADRKAAAEVRREIRATRGKLQRAIDRQAETAHQIWQLELRLRELSAMAQDAEARP